MTNAQAIAIMQKRNSAEDRFVLRAQAIQSAHGGRPTARLAANGTIEFVYPDGSITRSGVAQ
jgi:hypothetical protein